MVSKKKYPYECEGGIEKNLSLAITDCHHSASLVMPIGYPQDGVFYPDVYLYSVYGYFIRALLNRISHFVNFTL